MWRWLLAVCLLWVETQAEDAVSCPNHCRCYWDEDNYWAARCKVSAINPRSAEVFPSVKVLTIRPSHRSLPSVKLAPKMFQRFRNIKILNLINSSISHLPDDVFMGLHYVSDIDLSYNRISIINSLVFKNLRELHTLLLRGNPLILNTFSTIYSDSLKELDIGECGLKNIPFGTFANANSLTHLSLDRNYLQTINYQSVPNNLKYLNLASNKITNVPTKVLLSFSFLRRIDISDNPVNCTCSLLLMQDWFSGRGVALENDVICHSPKPFRGKNLNDINENELCSYEIKQEKQMNKLKFSPSKLSHSNHMGSEINVLHIYDIPMADAPKPDEAEVMFDNDESKALGTHLENNAYKTDFPKESLENIEGSGYDSDITTDWSEDRSSKTLDIDDKDRESYESTSETSRSSSDIDNHIGADYSGEKDSGRNNSSVEEENSSKNQSFEIDNPSENDSAFTENAHETSSYSPVSQSTSEDLESSGSGPLLLPETSSKVEITDDNEIFTSTTEPSFESSSEETSDSNLPTTSTESNLEASSHHSISEEASSSHWVSEEPPTTQGLPETSSGSYIFESSDSKEMSDLPSSSTTEEPIHVEVTESIIVRKTVVTEGLEHYSELSTEASIANETDDVAPRADTAGVAQSVTTYIIIAVIALPVIILILMAVCRRKSPRKVRLPQDTESNVGTELQDMDTLLPKNGGAENGVKVVPKANGAANPADSKSPEEVAPVLQAEPEPEPEPTIIEEPPPSRQNGSTTPIQKTKAKLTVIADSIPKTPVFIHKSYPD